MDPLSVTLAFVSFASFLKDTVELGLIIKSSIDKVGQNQKRLRVLASDVVYGLENLERYYRKHEYNLDLSAELKTALRRLHSELLFVRNRCHQIFPAARGSRFSLVRANVKAWARQDDIEADIVRLKEHINDCYLQFTAFTSARIEQKLIVHRVEDQIKLSRIEGLFTRWLVETHASHSLTNQIFASTTTIDFGHNNIEYQFLRLQIRRIVDLSANVVDFGIVTEVSMNLSAEPLVNSPAIPRADDEAGQLQEIFLAASQMLCFLRDSPTGVSIEDWRDQMSSFALSLYDFGMPDVVLGALVVNLCRILVKHNDRAFTPYLARALHSSSCYHAFIDDMEGSLVALQESLTICRLLHDTNPCQVNKLSLAHTLWGVSSSLSDEDSALASARESLSICRAVALEVKAISIASSMPDFHNELDISVLKGRNQRYCFVWPPTGNPAMVSYMTALSLRQLSYCLACAGSDDEAYATQQESLDILLGLAANYPDIFHIDLADAQYRVYHLLSRIGKLRHALSELEKAIVSYRLLAQRRPLNFTFTLIDMLSMYAGHLRDVGRDNEVPAIWEEAVHTFRILVNGSDSAIGPNVFKGVSSHLTALGRCDEAIAITKDWVDICRRRFRESQTAPSLASDTTKFIDAISTYTTLLRDIGRESEALAADEEALHAFRKIVNHCPDRALYLPNVFVGHSWHLRELGRHGEAIAIAKEGADMYRLLIRDVPQTAPSRQVAYGMGEFVDVLCMFLTLRDGEALAVEEEALDACKNLVNYPLDLTLDYPRDVFLKLPSQLLGLGRYNEAVAIAKKSLDICRPLICDHPGMKPSFASDLMNFAVELYCSHQLADSLAFNREAVEVYRSIPTSNPHHVAAFMRTLGNFAFYLHQALGDVDGALSACEEAFEVHRGLVGESLPYDTEICAWVRLTQAGMYYGMNRYNEALVALEAATALSRTASNRYLGDALTCSSNCLLALERAPDALVASEESMKILQDLEMQWPGLLACARNANSKSLATLGRETEALAAAEKAVILCRKVHQEDPCADGAFDYNLADIICNFSMCLAVTGHLDDALENSLEAVEIYRKITSTRPGFYPELAKALHSLSTRLSEAGRNDEALMSSIEAVEIYRQAVVTRPRRSTELAQALQSLSIRLWEAGRRDEAVDACAEIVDIRQCHVAIDPNSAPLLRQAQDELAARISDKVQLTVPPADPTQDISLCDQIPAATKGVLFLLWNISPTGAHSFGGNECTMRFCKSG